MWDRKMARTDDERYSPPRRQRTRRQGERVWSGENTTTSAGRRREARGEDSQHRSLSAFLARELDPGPPRAAQVALWTRGSDTLTSEEKAHSITAEAEPSADA